MTPRRRKRLYRKYMALKLDIATARDVDRGVGLGPYGAKRLQHDIDQLRKIDKKLARPYALPDR